MPCLDCRSVWGYSSLIIWRLHSGTGGAYGGTRAELRGGYCAVLMLSMRVPELNYVAVILHNDCMLLADSLLPLQVSVLA